MEQSMTGRRIATVVMFVALATLLGYAWFTTAGSAAMIDVAARPGVNLTGGTLWWP